MIIIYKRKRYIETIEDETIDLNQNDIKNKIKTIDLSYFFIFKFKIRINLKIILNKKIYFIF